MMRISVPRSSRWVAKLWRSAGSVIAFLTPATSAVSWNRRLSCRVVVGFPALAAADVASLRVRVDARLVLDHALAQRADGTAPE